MKMAGLIPFLAFIFSLSRHLRMFAILLVLILTQEASSRCGCNRAFEQGPHSGMNNEVPVAGDIFKASQTGGQSHSDPSYKHLVPNYKILQFHPTFLDFQEQPVGIPSLRSLTLSNPSPENLISLLSITEDVEPFYSSHFHTKVISPLSNTTIELVFLARAIGNVEKTIYIHTNKGAFPYQVFGTGVSNQYKLRSYVGARIPVEGNFSPYINMYNPYGETLRLTEMYSSGGFLHLELPSTTNDGAQRLWEIPAYETKPVIKATFKGKVLGNHTGFVRIKASAPAPKDQVVILPFHVQVSSEPGLYTNIDMFDFGTLRTMDEPKVLNLHLMNFGNKSLQILSISVEPPNKAISVNFTPMTLKAAKKYVRVATISYSALHTTSRRQHTGRVTVTYGAKGNKKLEIAYSAQVLQGTLAYSVGKTAFYAPDAVKSPVVQPLTITNTFSFPLIIYNASLPKDVDNLFSISNFSSPAVIRPQKLISPLSLKFGANDSNLSLSTTLRLYTNASIFTIPLHSYNGRMNYSVDGVEEPVLNYGTIGVGENRSLHFKIVNNNPIEISIREYSCNVNAEFVRLRLVDVKHNKKARTNKRSKWVQDKNNATQNNKTSDQNHITLRPNDVASFAVDVTAPPAEGTFTGEVRLKSIFEEIRIPVNLKTVVGSLISRPRRINFEQSFPGQSKSFALSLESSFSHAIQLTELKLHPPDSRFVFSWPSEGVPTLYPNTKTKVGWIQFDPTLGSDLECYLCLCKSDTDCLEWMNSLVLPTDTWELDLRLLEKIKKKWEALKESQETRINSSIILNSEIIKSYSIPVQASLTWPSVVEQSIYFPPTHTGNYSLQELVLNNPADVPVLVQVLPLMDYPHPPGGLDLVSDRLEIDSFSIELSGHNSFFLPDIKKEHKSDSRKFLETKQGIFPSSNAINLLLKRRSKEVITVGFKPDNELMKTSIIVVRNNLTVLDLVVVQGKGAHGQFTINNKKPGIGSLLLFEMKESHLADCHKSTPKARTYPSFTVKRTFSLNNPGQLPVHVTSFKINGKECDGYGFRVLNCEPFILNPNTSKKLDVTFTPDFTSSRVSRILQVITTMEPTLEFTLLATLPHHLLPLCASAMPKPAWEPYLHVSAAVTMTLLFILVIFMAYFDAQKYVIHCSFGSSRNSSVRVGRVTDIYTPRNLFDLNAGTRNKKFDKDIASNGSAAFVKDECQSSQGKRILDLQESSSTTSRSRSSSSSSVTTESHGKSTPSNSHSPLTKRDSGSKKDGSDNDFPTSNGRKGKKKSAKQHSADTEEKTKAQTEKKQKRADKQKEYRPAAPLFDKDSEIDNKARDETDRQTNSGVSGNETPSEEERTEVKNQHGKRSKKRVKRQPKKEEKEGRDERPYVPTGSVMTEDKDSEEEIERKPSSFTIVGSKAIRNNLKRNGNRNETSPSPSPTSDMASKNSLDKLDDISISGPKPEVHSENILPKTKQEQTYTKPKTTEVPRHRNEQQKRKNQLSVHRTTDTPTSLHDIADPVVAAALEKSLASKHKNRDGKSKLEKTQSGSGPSTPTSLSGSSRSGSYSSIVSENAGQGKALLNPTPGGPTRQDLLAANQGAGRVWTVSDNFHSFLPVGQNRRNSDDNSGGFSWRKQQFEIDQPKGTAPDRSVNNNSMFFYDNLSSLRATKKPLTEDEDHLRKAPGAKLPRQTSSRLAVIKSDLNPESSEFIPSPMREMVGGKVQHLRKPVGSGLGFDTVPPPPGLSRAKQQDGIWSGDDLLLNGSVGERNWLSGRVSRYGIPGLFSSFEEKGTYSSLIGHTVDTAKLKQFDTGLGGFSSTNTASPGAERNSLWANTNGFSSQPKDRVWPASGIGPSIWSSSGLTSTKHSLSSSLVGLDLCLPSYNEDTKDELADDSPIDPLESLWATPDTGLGDPYEGWSDDIKEK